MPLFKSTREKRLWLVSVLVIVAIFSTLVMGRPFESLLRSQDVQAVFFLLGMALVGATVLAHGLKNRTSKIEIAIWIGLLAVYLMLFFRLGAPERSHLIEYSVLAIFVHMALTERFGDGQSKWKPAFLALVITFSIGAIDECLQLFLPERVFDPLDIIFNGMAALFAIGSSMIIQWARRRMFKQKAKNS